MQRLSTWNRVGAAAGFVGLASWMISSCPLLLLLPTVVNGNGQFDMQANDLWEFWYMDHAETYYDYDTNTFTFDYKINMHMGVSVVDNLRADIFMSDCVTHVGVAEGIIFETINSNGEHVFQFDYTVLSKKDHIFITTGPEAAQADFCLRFGMWTVANDYQPATMVNWIDTLLIIYFNMNGKLSVEMLTKKTIDDGRGHRHQIFEEEKHNAYGYLCDPVTREAVGYAKVTQGMVLSVCIYIDETAVEQGLAIDMVYNFHWYKNETGTGNRITQVGFENGVNHDGLTITYCDGSNVTECHFDTMITAKFFSSLGTVWGEGMVFMKWALGDSGTERRRLRIFGGDDDALPHLPPPSPRDDSSLSPPPRNATERRPRGAATARRHLQRDVWKEQNDFDVSFEVEPPRYDAWQLLTSGGGPAAPSAIVPAIACALTACIAAAALV